MAEKGTLIVNQIAGQSIAIRDAYEVDDLGNPRMISRVQRVKHQCPANPVPFIRTGITGLDSLDLSSLIADITDNIIDCGNRTHLAIYGEFLGSLNTQNIRVMPIVFDSQGSPGIVTLLKKQTISVGSTSVTRNADNTCRFPQNQTAHWDLAGARKVGALVVDTATIDTTVNLRAWVY